MSVEVHLKGTFWRAVVLHVALHERRFMDGDRALHLGNTKLGDSVLPASHDSGMYLFLESPRSEKAANCPSTPVDRSACAIFDLLAEMDITIRQFRDLAQLYPRSYLSEVLETLYRFAMEKHKELII